MNIGENARSPDYYIPLGALVLFNGREPTSTFPTMTPRRRRRPHGRRVLESIMVIAGLDHPLLIDAQLVRRPYRRQTVDVNRRRAVDIDDLRLAVRGGYAGLCVVLEEAVQPGT